VLLYLKMIRFPFAVLKFIYFLLDLNYIIWQIPFSFNNFLQNFYPMRYFACFLNCMFVLFQKLLSEIKLAFLNVYVYKIKGNLMTFVDEKLSVFI